MWWQILLVWFVFSALLNIWVVFVVSTDPEFVYKLIDNRDASAGAFFLFMTFMLIPMMPFDAIRSVRYFRKHGTYWCDDVYEGYLMWKHNCDKQVAWILRKHGF